MEGGPRTVDADPRLSVRACNQNKTPVIVIMRSDRNIQVVEIADTGWVYAQCLSRDDRVPDFFVLTPLGDAGRRGNRAMSTSLARSQIPKV